MAATSRVVVGFFIDLLDQRTVGALSLAAQAMILRRNAPLCAFVVW